MWTIATTDYFDEWFNNLDQGSQVQIATKVELLKEHGPALARPHADTLKGSKHSNMKELRAKTSDKVLRIAFAFDQERKAILLVGGNKSGVGQTHFYNQLIAKADLLFDKHLAEVEAKRKLQS